MSCATAKGKKFQKCRNFVPNMYIPFTCLSMSVYTVAPAIQDKKKHNTTDSLSSIYIFMQQYHAIRLAISLEMHLMGA